MPHLEFDAEYNKKIEDLKSLFETKTTTKLLKKLVDIQHMKLVDDDDKKIEDLKAFFGVDSKKALLKKLADVQHMMLFNRK